MPRKKKKFDVFSQFDSKKVLSSPRSYMSLLYGAITVAVIFVIIFLGLRALSQRGGTIGENGVQTSETTKKTYVVKEGDTLWSIAEFQYGDPYMWSIISEANKLINPGSIEKGSTLVIPPAARTTVTPMATAKPTAQPTAMPKAKPSAEAEAPAVGEKITGNTYVVVKGDCLWNIAVRAYGDGFKWVDIAKANKLANPDLIHRGNKFVLPR